MTYRISSFKPVNPSRTPVAAQEAKPRAHSVVEAVGTQESMQLIGDRVIDPGRVFDLDLPLSGAAEGYQAMDERRAIKTLLRPFEESI